MSEAFLGEIRIFASRAIPRGWAPCNGQLLNISNHAALFSIIGNRFGGDGRVTFALPDLQGRTPIHASAEFPLGAAGGEAAHTLTIAEIPSHTHEVFASHAGANASAPKDNVWAVTGENRPVYADRANSFMSPDAIAPAGENVPHNNMQPYLALSFCIAVEGEYPPRS